MLGKNGSVPGDHRTHVKSKRRLFLATAAKLGIMGMMSGGLSATALADVGVNTTPQGGTVASGSATFSRPATNSLIVNQSSQRAIINWQSFDIGANAKTEFKQPNASSIAVNRVTRGGADPTQIMGTLKSNGQVVILDPNGVMFGAKSRVDVGGIVASTGSINTQKFMSGANGLEITGATKGKIDNRGTITAKDGGLVAFVAPQVVNSGVIEANMGRVELASGSAVTVDLYGDNMVQLVVTGETANALVSNTGTITADGGRVAMTAAAAKGVVSDVINMSGVIRARTAGTRNGRVVLKGGDTGTVRLTGDIDVTGTDNANSTGGYVEATGHTIKVTGADINASGNAGGGTVYIGGGVTGKLDGVKAPSAVTEFSAGSTVKADALKKGNGGTVVLWGTERTAFHGNITAKGGAKGGNGGFVEVSTGKGVVFAGMVDTTAAKGKMGELLIDPVSVYIGNGLPTPDGSYINAQNLSDTLVFSGVTISGTNNVDIVDDIDLSFSANFGSETFGDLKLSAPTLNIFKNVIMGMGGVELAGDTVNLGGTFTSGGNLMTGARLKGAASQVNVLDDGASLQQAMDVTKAGATVAVSSGTYTGNYNIVKSLTLRGNAGDALVEGADGAAPVLKGAVANGTIFTANGVSGVKIEGFSFDADVDGNAAHDSATGINATGSNNLTVTNNDFDGFTANAVNVLNADTVSVTYNDITNPGTGTITTTGVTNADIHHNLVPVVDDGGDDDGDTGGDTGGDDDGDTGGGDTGGGDTGGDGDGGDTGGDDDGNTGGGDNGGGNGGNNGGGNGHGHGNGQGNGHHGHGNGHGHGHDAHNNHHHQAVWNIVRHHIVKVKHILKACRSFFSRW